jgi:hypothetical protein
VVAGRLALVGDQPHRDQLAIIGITLISGMAVSMVLERKLRG